MKEELDLSKSRLILEGEKEDQNKWQKLISDRAEMLRPDQEKRRAIGRQRMDFYQGNQSGYSTVIGSLGKDKKGHASAVFNYAGKTAAKIAYSLANNPPTMTTVPRKVEDQFITDERARAQGVEEFVDEVLKINRFWKGSYRRACFNQVIKADAAIKVYPFNNGTKEQPEWEFKIVSHEKMENVLVGWRSDDPTEYDFVIVEDDRSIQSIEEEFGIVVPESLADKKPEKTSQQNSGHSQNGQWGTKGSNASAVSLPTGETNIPTVKVVEYDDDNVYAITIDKKLVQLVFKDNMSFPKGKFWIIVPNITNPGSPWSISDIDYLIDPQTELNEASNEERDYIRVGAGQKYVAYNMDEFDPESIKTGSGAVIFVNSVDGSSRFEPLTTNVNSFPVDSYLNRVRDHIHDLGLPKVTYGSGGADSGRSKAIDYQTMVDMLIFKRDSWELAMDKISEKIQRFGNFFFKELNIFRDPATDRFVVRRTEFDWNDILPLTQSDKIVNIVNKVQMGIPFRLGLKELGYTDVESVISEMKREAQDPDLMTFRSKLWQVAPGIIQASQEANASSQEINPMGGGESAPTLTTSQNSGRDSSLPISQRGGTTSVSSQQGNLDRVKQNTQAQGM